MHLTLYFGDLARTPCNFQIKEILEVQPELGVRVEVSCQAQRSLRRDSAPLVYYFADTSSGHVQFERKLVDCQAEWLHKVLTEDFTRMHRRHSLFRLAHIYLFFSLVIVDDFHIVAMALTPDKTDSPLIIDPNRVLPFPIASQCFQLISRRRSQNAQLRRSVNLEQFPQGDPFDGTEPPTVVIVKQILSFF